MRWIHLTVIALFVAATVLFAVQNFELVTMSFLGLSARVPLALLVAIIYVLGMATAAASWPYCAGRSKGQGALRRSRDPI